MFDEIPDPKKLEEFNIQSGIKTLGINNYLKFAKIS